MKIYKVDVTFSFDVGAHHEQEAKAVVLDGFKHGKYIPNEDEISVYEDERGR